jgi:hypothetical protein
VRLPFTVLLLTISLLGAENLQWLPAWKLQEEGVAQIVNSGNGGSRKSRFCFSKCFRDSEVTSDSREGYRYEYRLSARVHHAETSTLFERLDVSNSHFCLSWYLSNLCFRLCQEAGGKKFINVGRVMILLLLELETLLESLVVYSIISAILSKFFSWFFQTSYLLFECLLLYSLCCYSTVCAFLRCLES